MSIYLVGGVGGLVIFLPSMWYVLGGGHLRLFLLDAAGMIWSLIALWQWKRLSQKIRSLGAIVFIYAIGLGVLLSVGPVSGGIAWLFTFSVVAAILMGLRPAVAAVGANVLTVALIYALMVGGSLPWSASMAEHHSGLVVASLNFLMLDALVAISVAMLLRALDRALQGERAARADLLARSQDLDRVNVSLRQEAQARMADQEALARSAEGLAMIMNSVDAQISVIDLQSHEVIFANQEMRESLGFNPEGKICWQVLQQNQEGPCAFCTNSRLLTAEGLPAPPVVSELCNALTQRTYVVTDRAIRWVDGRMVRLEIAVDITERKKAEQAVEEREARLTSILRAAPVGIALVEDRVFVAVNQRLCEIVGYTEEELLQQPTRMLYPNSQQYDHVGREYSQLDHQKTGTVEAQWLCKDGTIKDILLNATSIEAGSFSRGITFTALDITETKKAEKALRLSEERNRLIIDNCGEGITVLQDGRNIFFNRQAQEILGNWGNDFSSMDFWQCVHPDDQDMIKERHQRRLRGESVPTGYDFRVIDPSGQIKWVNTYSVMIEWEGRPATINMLSDITERKLASETLRIRLELIEYADHHSLQEFLVKVVDEVGNLVGSPIGFYHFVDPDQKGVSLQAWSTRTSNEFCQVDDAIPQHYDLDKAGVWLDCVRERRPVIHNDYASLPHKKGMPAGHAHLQRELVAPIMRLGRVVAVMGIGNKTVDYTDKDVEVVSYLADVAWEIAERKRVEEEIQKSQQKMSNILEATPLGIHAYHLTRKGQLRFSYANPAADAIIGRDHRPLLGGIMEDVFPTAQDRGIPEMLKRVAREGVAWNGEILSNSEPKRIFEVRAFQDEAGSVTTMFSDITERRLADQALQASEQRYRELTDSMTDIIYTQDMEGRFTSFNQALTNILGYPTQELLGRRASEMMRPDLKDAFDTEYLGALKSQGTFSGISSYRHQDGGLRYLEYTSQLVRDSKGEPYISGIARNVTDRVQQERRLNQLQSQLLQAQKMQAIGTLAGGIAHDFNNILSAIMGHGELASLAASMGKDNSPYLEQIIKATERARDLVKQILTFSRRSATDMKPLNMNKMVTNAVEMLKYTIPKMIDIRIEHKSEKCFAIADAVQMDQVIMNLASNAADAMPDGGSLTFSIETMQVSEDQKPGSMDIKPGRYVFIMVTDTGKGMTQDTVERIFEPFFTTKEIGKGTGLGLSTVYGIIEEHGGHIRCDSKPGAGTTFTIALPALSENQEFATSKEGLLTDAPKGVETILFVDDEQAIREVAAEILEGAGYRVMLAASGEQALELYGKAPQRVALVVMDLGMPGMGGRKCLRELLAVNPSLKVLIASGYSADGNISDTLEEGATGFIAKPFKTSDFLQIIRSMLDDPGLQAAANQQVS